MASRHAKHVIVGADWFFPGEAYSNPGFGGQADVLPPAVASVTVRAMTSGPAVVVLGMTNYAPYAGVSWQTAESPEGFLRLGYDVSSKITATGRSTPSQVHADDCTETVRFINDLITRFGLQDRWAYRDVVSTGQVFGLSAARFAYLLGNADLLVNPTGSTVLEERYARVPARVYLETDPCSPRSRSRLAIHARASCSMRFRHLRRKPPRAGLRPVREYAYIPSVCPRVRVHTDAAAGRDRVVEARRLYPASS